MRKFCNCRCRCRCHVRYPVPSSKLSTKLKNHIYQSNIYYFITAAVTSLRYYYFLFCKSQCVVTCRYGNIFKTHILGCPCVMISSPEAAKIVLVSQAHLFKPTYPPSKEKMIGPEALFFHQGAYHSRLKKLVQASFVPSALRGSVPDIEKIVLGFLPTWDGSTVNALQEMKRVIPSINKIFHWNWIME